MCTELKKQIDDLVDMCTPFYSLIKIKPLLQALFLYLIERRANEGFVLI